MAIPATTPHHVFHDPSAGLGAGQSPLPPANRGGLLHVDPGPQTPMTLLQNGFSLVITKGSFGGWMVQANPDDARMLRGHTVYFSNTADMFDWLVKNLKD